MGATSAGYYYLCDASDPNAEGFLAPYRGQRYHLTEWRERNPPKCSKDLFNMRHSYARNVIESAFGSSKDRGNIEEPHLGEGGSSEMNIENINFVEMTNDCVVRRNRQSGIDIDMIRVIRRDRSQLDCLSVSSGYTTDQFVLGVPLGSLKTRFVSMGSQIARVRERASSWTKVKVEESWRATEKDL
ncbi:putative nuclease HARBI1 [Cucumis melo var. makuwa]|uniref:Putative nuclease HARBI1 n=1 Tax=Cucumis melo var. makuwa TaxID=1194695 RepID=A0A5D3CNQ0_CUCMM|nr:putative nuclease HARBI1 [Cucumis melo var. makuwa]